MNENLPKKDFPSRGINPVDKGLRLWLNGMRSRPSLTYLVIFSVMIFASLLMYTAVETGGRTGAVVLLLLVVLANLLSLIF